MLQKRVLRFVGTIELPKNHAIQANLHSSFYKLQQRWLLL